MSQHGASPDIDVVAYLVVTADACAGSEGDKVAYSGVVPDVRVEVGVEVPTDVDVVGDDDEVADNRARADGLPARQASGFGDHTVGEQAVCVGFFGETGPDITIGDGDDVTSSWGHVFKAHAGPATDDAMFAWIIGNEDDIPTEFGGKRRNLSSKAAASIDRDLHGVN